MSYMDYLILNLELDQILNNEVLDSSNKNNHGKVQGYPRIINDDLMDKVLSFEHEGDYILLPGMDNVDFSNGLTIEAWVNFASFQSSSRIIDFGIDAGSENILLSNVTTTNGLTFHIFRNGNDKYLQA